MQAFVSLLTDGVAGELSKDQAHYLNRVEANIGRLSRIIDNLLLIAQADEEKIILDKRLLDFSELLAQIEEDYKVPISRKHQKLSRQVEGALPEFFFDSDRLMQVFISFLYGKKANLTLLDFIFQRRLFLNQRSNSFALKSA